MTDLVLRKTQGPLRLIPPDTLLDLGTIDVGETPPDRTLVVECNDDQGGSVTTPSPWLQLSARQFQRGITAIRVQAFPSGLPAGAEHLGAVRLSSGSQGVEVRVRLRIRRSDEATSVIVTALEHLTGHYMGTDGIDIGEMPESSDIGFELNDLLQVMLKHAASDLHLKVGAPPTVRIDGELIPIGESSLTHRDCLYLVLTNMTDKQRKRLYSQKYLDYACEIPGARFRVNAFVQKGTLSAAYRLLRVQIPTIEDLGLPNVIRKLASVNDGLILVTGPASSGKSTTLAAMVDYINTHSKKHIITIEDPIEFLHSDKLSLVTQREIGTDAPSYAESLKQALRQDPNVLLVGEMRDPETMLTAAVAAETGHLVLSTLHTPNTTQAVDRILDTFSGDQQRQFRMLLSRVMRGVISQKLVGRSDDRGRCVATEVLVVTPTIASLLLEGKTHEIYDHLKEGGIHGMQTFTQSFHRLFSSKLITKAEAYRHADQLNELRLMIDGHITETTYSEDPAALL